MINALLLNVVFTRLVPGVIELYRNVGGGIFTVEDEEVGITSCMTSFLRLIIIVNYM